MNSSRRISKHSITAPDEAKNEENTFSYEDQEEETIWGALRRGNVANFVEPRLRDQPEYSNQKWIIYPDDKAYIYWGYVIISLLVYTALVTPFAIALINIDTLEWFIIDIIVDGLFFTDLILNWLLAYYDDQNVLVISRKKIFTHYLRTWMLIDLIACFPFQLLLSTGKDYESLVRVARLPRLYRLVKMAKLARMLKIVRNRKKIIRNMNNMMKVSFGVERLLWFTITFVIMMHLIACLWIMVAQFNEYDYDNWILRNQWTDASTYTLYMAAFYWTVTTITTVGYGDILAYNNVERIYCSVIMIIGVFLYSYTIGSLSSILLNLDARREKLNKKIEILAELSREFKMKTKFYNRLAGALEYDHNQSRNEIKELLDCLPSNLRNQLLIVIYSAKIKNNMFFANKSSHFIAFIVPQLKPQMVEPHDFIYKQGDYITEMYFLIRGEVSVVFAHNDEWIPYRTIQEGYYFGEVDIWFSDDKRHMDTTKSNEKSELLALGRENFENAMKNFENECIELSGQAEERWKRNRKLRRSAETEYKSRQKVARHVSIPQNPFMNSSSKLAASTTRASVLETIGKLKEVWSNKEKSFENNEAEASDDSSDEDPETLSTQRTNDDKKFSRSPTLFENLAGPARKNTLTGQNSPWHRLMQARRGDDVAKDSNLSQKDEERMNRMEKTVNEMHYLITQVCRTLNESTPGSAQLGIESSLDSNSPISQGIMIPVPRFGLNLERVESVDEDLEEAKEKTVSPPNVSDEENQEVGENIAARLTVDKN